MIAIPFWNGVATFTTFLIAGIAPLLVYSVGLVIPIPSTTAFVVVIALSGAVLFALDRHVGRAQRK